MTLPQNAAPEPVILGWVLQVLPPGDDLHHAVVAVAESGDITTLEGMLIPHGTGHCYHIGRDVDVRPKCEACATAAGIVRRAEATEELAISSTYSRHG